jgi:DNA modification methylase
VSQLPQEIADVLSGALRYCVVQADCRDVLSALPDRSIDVHITDPPYSDLVHRSVRSAKRNELPDVEDFGCRTRRIVDLGFEHMRPAVRRAVARESARAIKRWSLFFADVESSWMWRLSCQAAGLEYVRTCEWRRIGGAPQFTGDRPSSAFETITCVHPEGRKRWNGGGKAGAYEYNIVANRLGERGSRVHPTQKPFELMLDIVADFSDPDEVVLDSFCGSGTTLRAALRLGRRAIGIERDANHAETARDVCAAELQMSSIQKRRAKQEVLFK